MASGSNSVVKNKRGYKPRLLYIVIGVLVVVVVAGGIFGYSQYTKLQNENKRLSNPQEAAKSETERIKAEVAALIDIPTDEEPTIASVVDASKLSGQAFFVKAQNGDKVIMFQKAKKAILYRPSTKKIIEVAPINIGDSAENKAAAMTPAPAPTPTPAGTETVDPSAATQ